LGHAGHQRSCRQDSLGLNSTPADNNVKQEEGDSEETVGRDIEPIDVNALKGLDDGLPENLMFNLETDFYLHRFFDTLADEGPGRSAS
jgi:hypothetical protein